MHYKLFKLPTLAYCTHSDTKEQSQVSCEIVQFLQHQSETIIAALSKKISCIMLIQKPKIKNKCLEKLRYFNGT